MFWRAAFLLRGADGHGPAGPNRRRRAFLPAKRAPFKGVNMRVSNRRLEPWLAAVLGGLTVLAAGGLWQALVWPRAAVAQVPDSGLQRKEMIDELRLSNKKLTEIAGVLREIRDLQAQRKDSALPKGP